MATIHNAFATRLLAELLGHEVDSGLLLKEERPNNNPQTLHVKCAIVLGKEVVNFPKKILEEDIPPPLWKVISEYMCPWTLLKLGEEFLTSKGVNVAECWRNHYNRRWPWKYGRSALDLLDRHNLTHRQLYIDRHFMKLLEEYCRMYQFGQLKANHPERILSHDLMWCSVNEYDPKVPCYLPKKVQAAMKKDTMGSRVLALARHVTSLTLNASLSLFLEYRWDLVMELLESVELLRIQCYPTVTESNCCWNIIETFLRHGKLQEFSLTFAKCSDGFVDLFERLMTICAGLDHSEPVSSNDLSFDCDISGCSDDIFNVSIDEMGQSVEKKLRGHQSENFYFCTDSCSNFRQSCYRSFKRPSTSSLFENSDDKDEETEEYPNKDEVDHDDNNGSANDTYPCPKHAVNFPNTRQILSENELDSNRPGVSLRCKKFRRNLSSYLALSKSQSGSASESNLLNSMLRHQRLGNHAPSSFSHSHCHMNLETSPKSRKCWKSSINRFDSKNCPHSENVNCLSQAKLDGGCCCRLREYPAQSGKFSKLCPYRTKEDHFPYLSTTRLHSMKYETKRKTSFSVLTALLSNSYDESMIPLKPSDRHRYYRPLGNLHNHSSSSTNAGTTSGHSANNGVTQWSEGNVSVQGILCEQENLSNCCMKPEKNKSENRTYSLFDSPAATSSITTPPPNSPNTSDPTHATPPTQDFKHEESMVPLDSKWGQPQMSKDIEGDNLQSLLDSINSEEQKSLKSDSNFKNPNCLSNRKRRHSGGNEIAAWRGSAADAAPTLKPKNHDKRRVSFDIYADLDDDDFPSKPTSVTDDSDVLQREADSPDSGCRLQSPTHSQPNSPTSTPKSCKSDSSLWDLCLGLTKSNSGAYISKATHGLKSLRIIGDPAPHIGYVLRDILPMWPALQKLYLNVTGLNNPELLDVIGDLLDKKQLKDLSIIGCETEDGVFRRALQCLHNSYRDDGEKNGLNLLNIQSFADPSITFSATLPPAQPLYGVKNLILRDNIFDIFGVSGLLRLIEFDNALIKLNLKCSYLHAWMGQLLAAIARKGQIEELYLGSNQIEGSHSELELIKVLNQCKNLKRLDLRSCSLRSQVVSSESFISAIRNHKSLEFLCLKGNRLGITILSLIDKLHDKKEPFSLKSLNVSGNPFNVERYGVDTLLKTYRCQPRVPWLLELKMKACFQISTREREADIHNYVGKWISAFAKHVSFNIEVSSSGMRFVEYADANSVVYM